MIDTDKYEGHTEGDWYIDEDSILRKIWTDEDDKHRQEQLFGFDIMIIPENVSDADMWLIADAPLLLAEVKRLREALLNVYHTLIWDEKDREMDDDPITIESLVEILEEVRSDIAKVIE